MLEVGFLLITGGVAVVVEGGNVVEVVVAVYVGLCEITGGLGSFFPRLRSSRAL